MKKASFVLAVLFALVFVQVVSADAPAPGGPFSSFSRCKIVSSSAASCFYQLL